MAYITSAVYDPPAPGLPYVAVIFDTSGEVLTARTVPSAAAGEKLIADVMGDLAARIAADNK